MTIYVEMLEMLKEAADFIESCAYELDDPVGASTFAYNIRVLLTRATTCDAGEYGDKTDSNWSK